MAEIKIKWQRTPKQVRAWQYLTDMTTKLLFFGGGAGGAKSFLGCAWVILSAVTFKGSRWFIARKELKSLKESTLETFFEVCNKWGLKAGEHYRYNQQDGYILFKNGSKVVLKELKHKPSDADYESVGSTEYTGGFIDEATQVTEKAVEVMQSRIRFKLDDFGICERCQFMGDVDDSIKPPANEIGERDPLVGGPCPQCKEQSYNSLVGKMLLTGNPSKNWTYRVFYLPWKALKTGIGKPLAPGNAFIQALVTDNPFSSKRYIENLRAIKNRATRERLLLGNWEWDDDDAKLMDYGKIVDIFSNNITAQTENKFISCDVARRGKDKAVVMLWHGYVVKKIIVLPKDQYYKTTQISAFLKSFARREGVPRSNIVIDEGGVGGGVVDEMSETDGHNQVYAFNGASSQIQPEIENDYNDKDRIKLNYGNLRAQCFDAMADAINDNQLAVNCYDSEQKDLIIEELGQIKQKDLEKDGPFYIIAKEKIIEALGRSPDFADTLSMRFVFDLGVNEDQALITEVNFA